ncbi:serine/threonine kinase [Geminocystis sp. NIES-3709]|nr:serine/threonine kinase [Geminocystis sp. NIES-3709]
MFFGFILTFSSGNFFNSLQAQTPSNSQNTPVSNDVKIDFTNLTQLLTDQNWRRANDETRRIILQATGRTSVGWIPPSDLQNLSCSNLKTIDTLWKENSNGRFGFSVQFPIYVETGNRPGRLVSDDAFNRFGNRVGWRKNEDWIIFIENLNYTDNAPIGHFPNPRPEYSITGGRLLYSTLAQRMVECNLVTYEK